MKLKIGSNIAKSFNAVIAGLLIGLGVIINTQMQIPIIGPMLFSFGLLVIINMQLNLYTGKIGFITHLKETPFLLTADHFTYQWIHIR